MSCCGDDDDEGSVLLVNTAVYVLDSKYYQKIGEVWDHETKDFKILYKPLYCCPSKTGSYEAHHLATSTFERWNRKFSLVRSCDIESLPAEVKSHVVATRSVQDLSAGNNSLPLLSTELPKTMQKGSTRVTTIIEEPPLPVSHRPLSASASSASVSVPHATATTVTDNITCCRSISGFGSRSLTPYFLMDFSPEFQMMIIKGLKKATTRILKPNVENGEPHLQRIVNALKEQEQHQQQQLHVSRRGVVASAVSDEDDSMAAEVFAVIRITSVECMLFSEITPELATIEQFASLDSFKACLRTFYPWIQDDDAVHVFHFELDNK